MSKVAQNDARSLKNMLEISKKKTFFYFVSLPNISCINKINQAICCLFVFSLQPRTAKIFIEIKNNLIKVPVWQERLQGKRNTGSSKMELETSRLKLQLVGRLRYRSTLI